MHRLRTYTSVIRFRTAAFFWLLGGVLLLAAFGMMGWGVLKDDRQWFHFGALTLVALIPVILIQWISSMRAYCPLCLVPSMARKSCQKNRKARKLLGSYRTRVAFSVIFRGTFICPYCAEPTCVQVREPARVNPPARGAEQA